jgi:hypothetical protein
MACFLPSWYKFYCVLARSRYKFDRSHEFIPSYKVGGGHWRSVALQIISEAENCHGVGIKLQSDARVRVQEQLQNWLGCRSKSKKHDKQLTHIVRVIASVILKLSRCYQSLSHGMQNFLFASSFKSFGVAVASEAFKCACKNTIFSFLHHLWERVNYFLGL